MIFANGIYGMGYAPDEPTRYQLEALEEEREKEERLLGLYGDITEEE